MVAAYVKDTGIATASGVSSDTASFGSLPSAGSYILVAHSRYTAGGTSAPTFSDNQSNSYSVQSTPVFFVDEVIHSQAFAENIGSPTGTFTITATGGTDLAWVGVEVSGLKATGARRYTESDTLTGPSSTDANLTTASTAAQIGDFIFASACATVSGSNDVGFGAAPTTGYTNIGFNNTFQSNNTISADYKIATSGGAQSVQWSHQDVIGGSSSWGCLLSAFEPAPGGVDVAVPSKAFSLTGQVPGVSTGINITAPVKNFLKTGQLPVIGTGANVNAPVGAFALSGHVPAFRNSINVQAPAKAYSLTGQVPGVGTGVDIASPAKAFTLSPNVPVISAGATTIRPPAKAYALTGHAPTVAIGVNIFAPAKAFVLTAFIPVIGIIQASLRRLAFVLRELRTAFVQPEDRTAVVQREDRTASVPREDRSARV